jgi:DNA-damage-inducible protein D
VLHLWVEHSATEITKFNVKQHDLKGEVRITDEQVKNNKDVRGLLGKSGIKPEQLPAEEDIKKLERRVKYADKGIEKKKLKGNKYMSKEQNRMAHNKLK